MMMFIVFFNSIRKCFKFNFHADTLFKDDCTKAVKCCKIITIAVELMYLCFCIKLNISILLNLFTIMIIATLDSLLEFYLEKSLIKENKLKDLDTLKKICKEANLTKIATQRLIMRYIEKKSIIEIANIEYVDEETIKKSIQRSKKKLKELDLLN